MEEYGIEVEGHGCIKATVVSTAHDNLAAHMMFGMVLGFNSKYFCRFCKMNLDESKIATKLDPSLARTNIKEELEVLMSKLEPGHQLDPHNSFGFKLFSELHGLKHCRMEDCSSVDPLHDLLEGVFPRDLQMVFNYMMNKMKVDERDIKNCIDTYKYGPINNNHKPANVKINKEGHSLGLSAIQVKTLILHFPFIFGYLFKTEEEKSVLEFLIDCVKISIVAFKNVVTETEILELETCISKHLSTTIEFFGATLTRKHHFLLHYPDTIRRLGPTSLMNTAPYEHKHIFFTRLIRKTSINKNILKTIAIRHQSQMTVKPEERFTHITSFGKISEPKDSEVDMWTNKFSLPKSKIEKISCEDSVMG